MKTEPLNMKPVPFNTQLHPLLYAAIKSEADETGSIYKTVSAAVYWYFYGLNAEGRATARRDCRKWLNKVPLLEPAADELAEAARQTVLARANKKSKGRSKSG